MSMSSTQTVVAVEDEKKTPRLAIPDNLLNRLDLEWVNLWEKHGSSMVRADELSIEEFRKNPAAYSFIYATYVGRSNFR